MPAHEAPPPVPSDDDAHENARDVDAREVDREAGGSGASKPVPAADAGASTSDQGGPGALGWVRQNVRGLIAAVILAIAAFAAFSGPGSGGGDEDGGRGSGGGGADTTVESTGAADPGDEVPPPDDDGSSVTDEPEGPTTTLTPPDVDSDRPAIDLATPPPAGNAAEVARWWAATYTSYIGAETPAALATRLTGWTTQGLLDELGALPPAASYDPPVAVGGVSVQEIPPAAGDTSGGNHQRVSVETDFALVIYDLTLVDAGGTWQVSEATRL
jgi:hypothetical protein